MYRVRKREQMHKLSERVRVWSELEEGALGRAFFATCKKRKGYDQKALSKSLLYKLARAGDANIHNHTHIPFTMKILEQDHHLEAYIGG